MRPGKKYMVALGFLIGGILVSVYFESYLKEVAKVIFESSIVSIVIATVAFSISFIHKIRYTSVKLHNLSYDQYSGFGEELFSLLGAPITVVGSWSLLSAYGLQSIYEVERYVGFTGIDMNFILLASSYFLISSSVVLWKKLVEIRKDTKKITPVEEDAKEPASSKVNS